MIVLSVFIEMVYDEHMLVGGAAVVTDRLLARPEHELTIDALPSPPVKMRISEGPEIIFKPGVTCLVAEEPFPDRFLYLLRHSPNWFLTSCAGEEFASDEAFIAAGSGAVFPPPTAQAVWLDQE